MMFGKEVRHLLIELAQVVFDQSQFCQRQLQEPAIHWIQRRARTEGVGQLVRRGAQTLVRQRRQRRGIRFSTR